MGSDMWLSIWTWSFLSFGVTHFVAGCVFAFTFRKEQSIKMLIGIIFGYTAYGLMIPLSAGALTGT